MASATFGALVTAHLERCALSQRAFAELVGMRQGQVNDLVRGRFPMPVRRIEAWADALGLAGDDRDRFREEALLTRAPTEIRDLVERLRAKVTAAEKPRERRNRVPK
jgi:transcriptional regulator with XRE-family HTH domain